MTPRQPTTEEKEQLANFILRGEDPEMYDEGQVDPESRAELQEVVERARIAVFDNYTTDTPIYSGKLMVVVWPSTPQATQVYTWHDGYLWEEVINP